MTKTRTVQEILDQAKELALFFETYDPDAKDASEGAEPPNVRD